MSVPLFAAQGAIAPHLPAIAATMARVLEDGRYVLGPQVSAFEQEFAAYLGADECVGVGNGTDAITIALRALGVEPGDEVIVPAVTFYATAEAAVNAGAEVVFADVDPQTWCVTAETVEPLISERTKAILPVHLFGNLAPIGELAELARNRSGKPIRLLEDAAQAAGATLDGNHAGSLADAATFSFYPSKNLGAFGDGGAILSDDPAVAEACRRLRFHGSADKKIHEQVGYNSRLDELQAAALRLLLPELDSWTESRRAIASAYRELGLGELVDLPVESEGARSCFHLYVVSTPRRDELAAGLTERGIGNRVYYTPPLHRQPGLARFAPSQPLPGAEQFAAESLALPMGQAMERSQAEAVVEAVADVLRSD